MTWKANIRLQHLSPNCPTHALPPVESRPSSTGPEVLMCFTPVSSSRCLPLVVAPQPAAFLWAAHNVAGTVSRQVRPLQSRQLLLETPGDGVRCANLSKLNSIIQGFESLADWLLVRKERGWNPFILEVSQYLVPLLARI